MHGLAIGVTGLLRRWGISGPLMSPPSRAGAVGGFRFLTASGFRFQGCGGFRFWGSSGGLYVLPPQSVCT